MMSNATLDRLKQIASEISIPDYLEYLNSLSLDTLMFHKQIYEQAIKRKQKETVE